MQCFFAVSCANPTVNPRVRFSANPGFNSRVRVRVRVNYLISFFCNKECRVINSSIRAHSLYKNINPQCMFSIFFTLTLTSTLG